MSGFGDESWGEVFDEAVAVREQIVETGEAVGEVQFAGSGD